MFAKNTDLIFVSTVGERHLQKLSLVRTEAANDFNYRICVTLMTKKVSYLQKVTYNCHSCITMTHYYIMSVTETALPSTLKTPREEIPDSSVIENSC